jgi:predicted ATPase
LTRIGGGKPLVLILENLHGAEASIEALQYVVRRLGPTPTLIVGSYRQTETDKRHPLTRMLDSFADDPRFVSIPLGPFSPSEHRSLVASLVGAPKVDDVLAKRLHDATEGNPFFTKELIRSLVDSGGISRDDTGGWSFSKEADISADALPATIQQAVEKRIERLPEELRDTLSIASVLGKTFDARDLETLADASRDLDDDLDRLLRDGILEEERESRGDRLTFASGIVRDVLYAALSRRKRRSLHRKYAELVEKRSAGRLERVYPELVHHFSQADVPDKTVEYGLKLAQKSLDTFSPEETIRVAKIALEYLEDEEWTGDPSLEGQARLLLAQGQRMTGNVDAALREAEAAAKALADRGKPGAAVGAMLLAAETAWQARRIDDSSRWIERGLEAARAAVKAAEPGAPDRLGKLLALAAAVVENFLDGFS